MSEAGITTAVLKGANTPSDSVLGTPDAAVHDGISNCPVEHVVYGREVYRDLPGNLQSCPHN